MAVAFSSLRINATAPIYYIRCARSGFLKGEAFQDSCPARKSAESRVPWCSAKQTPGGRQHGDGYERLRLSDLIEMPCAGSTGEGHLWPKALPGGPLARWHKPQLSFAVGIESDQKAFARTMFGQLKHVKKSLRDVFRFAPRTAIETRISRTRLRAVEKSTASSRTYSDSNPHAARTIRSKIVWAVSIWYGYTLFRTEHGKILPPTHICAF